MAKPTKLVKGVLEKYGLDAETSCWDCHGTLVIYHKACQIIATMSGIEFSLPQIVHQDADKGSVVILVEGTMPVEQGGQKAMWSFGEATPKNNKNSYPYAMAEKRAKDRITLGLAGIHGFVYSEMEADEFKDSAPAPLPETVKAISWPDELNTALLVAGCENKSEADQVCRWLWESREQTVDKCRSSDELAQSTINLMDANTESGISREDFLKESKEYAA